MLLHCSIECKHNYWSPGPLTCLPYLEPVGQHSLCVDVWHIERRTCTWRTGNVGTEREIHGSRKEQH